MKKVILASVVVDAESDFGAVNQFVKLIGDLPDNKFEKFDIVDILEYTGEQK